MKCSGTWIFKKKNLPGGPVWEEARDRGKEIKVKPRAVILGEGNLTLFIKIECRISKSNDECRRKESLRSVNYIN